jgi:hypothetical protein
MVVREMISLKAMADRGPFCRTRKRLEPVHVHVDSCGFGMACSWRSAASERLKVIRDLLQISAWRL